MEVFINGDSFGYWEIGLTGAKEGVMHVGWSCPNDQRIGNFDMEDLFGKKRIEGISILCEEENSPTYGDMSWEIKLVDQQKVGVSYEWSCGSMGCSIDIAFYYKEENVRQLSCR